MIDGRWKHPNIVRCRSSATACASTRPQRSTSRTPAQGTRPRACAVTRRAGDVVRSDAPGQGLQRAERADGEAVVAAGGVESTRWGELVAARCDEFELEAEPPVWHLPGIRTRTGQPLDIPPPTMAVQWLQKLKELRSVRQHQRVPARADPPGPGRTGQEAAARTDRRRAEFGLWPSPDSEADGAIEEAGPARACASSCNALGVPVALEASCSGNGADAWIFLSARVSARDARRLGTALASHTCARTRQRKLGCYDRLFANRDTMPASDRSSCGGASGNAAWRPVRSRPASPAA